MSLSIPVENLSKYCSITEKNCILQIKFGISGLIVNNAKNRELDNFLSNFT